MLIYVPNNLPTGQKANIRAQIDITKEVSHCGTVEVSLDCTGETSTVNRQGPFCSFRYYSRLVASSSRHTVATYTPD